MRKFKYLIGSIILIIIMILIFIPRKIEKFYIIYDKNENNCNQKIIEQNFVNGSYIICDDTKFINFQKSTEEKAKTMSLNTLEKFKIISNKELLEKFNNNLNSKTKNDFDLLDREKKFEFNLIIIDKELGVLELIPVKQIRVLCILKLETE